MNKELDTIFGDVIKNIPKVPDMSNKIYSTYNKNKKTELILSKNKIRFILTSLILMLLIGISIPFITKWFSDSTEQIARGSMYDGYSLTNNSGIINMYDCYSNSDNDVFTIFIEELNMDKLIIEENKDKIINVKIKDNEETVLKIDNSYIINVSDINSIYIDIYFEKGIYQTNNYKLKKSKTNGAITEELNYDDGNLTQIRFNCYANEISPTNKVEVMYYFSRNIIGNTPLVKRNGVCDTLQDALLLTDFDYILANSTLEVYHVIYDYNNRNNYSSIEYQYGVNNKIYTVVVKGVGVAPSYPFDEFEKDEYTIEETIHHDSGIDFIVYSNNKNDIYNRHCFAYAYIQNGNNYEYYKIQFKLFTEDIDFSIHDYITNLIKIRKKA